MTCDAYLEQIKREYQLLNVLSSKNGSQVLRLRHLRLGREIVLKRYQKEIRSYDLLKQVRHNNIPEVYDTISLEDGQIVLEEYISGLTIAQILECGTYTYHGAKKVLFGVCSAVGFLHSMGIVHRDIKPENILISETGIVKLLDMDATRQVAAGIRRDTEVLGTIGYAPPEQFGLSQSDARTDIYAMGVLLNVMLTGQHPSCLLAKGKAGRIVKKCTSIDPGSRYPTIKKLLMAL